MGTLNHETGAIELDSNHSCAFRMYGEGPRCYYIHGIYGPNLFVRGRDLQEAFDFLADETAELDGMYVDDILEEAYECTFPVGGYGHYLSSDEWFAREVTRKDIFHILGYSR